MGIGRASGTLVVRFIIGFVIATLFGWLCAMATGAMPIPAFMVALFFGFCSGGGVTLLRLSNSEDK